ncbi:MAG: hypothetical protein ACK5QC_16625 [Bacteroidota bacterium]
MKIQIILTILLIGFALWAALHYGEKARLDRIADKELRDSLKNNHDSIYLSDIKYFHRDRQINNTDSLLIRRLGPNNVAEISLDLYDNKTWKISLPKEKMNFQAYQDEKTYFKKFKKSAIHLIENQSFSKFPGWDWSLKIFNTDTSSRILALTLTFYRGQIKTVTTTYEVDP